MNNNKLLFIRALPFNCFHPLLFSVQMLSVFTLSSPSPLQLFSKKLLQTLIIKQFSLLLVLTLHLTLHTNYPSNYHRYFKQLTFF